jgi:hypothetical protein
MKNVRTIIISIVFISVSIGLGYFLGTKSLKKAELELIKPKVVSDTSPISLVNPMLPCIQEMKLNMKELKSFRPALDSYLAKIQIQNPEIHISYYTHRDSKIGFLPAPASLAFRASASAILSSNIACFDAQKS